MQQDCIDKLVHVTQHWLPSHAQCKTADGELNAASGSLSSTESLLLSKLEQLSRSDDWDSANYTGNHVCSVPQVTVLRSYGHHATQLGYQKTRSNVIDTC